MGTWGKNKPPSWRKDAVATRAGWCHPVTGEVLAACGGLSVDQGDAIVQSVKFAAKVLAQGNALKVLVGVDEKVNVTAGATIQVASTGAANPITLTALAQVNVSKILFEGIVPSESATLSIPVQSIIGTIVDQEGTTLNHAINAAKALTAGTRVIA